MRTEGRLDWGLVGHDWAIRALALSIATERVAHAYLLTGPHGIGKTTLARALAQTLECTETNRPCGKCLSCLRIGRDRHPDVQIVEGVPVGYKFDEKAPPPPPRTGDWERRILKIDQVRAIQHTIALAPFEARWKIVILRRFEEANEEAANAFLKTLEEPPSHTRLILTARDVSLLLPTIASRCQVLALRPLPSSQIENALVERWNVEQDKARWLARWSGGRLGWAVRASMNPALLETRRAHLDALDAAVHEGLAERLVRAEALTKKAEDLPEVLELWMGWWRDILLMQSGDSSKIINVERAESLQEQAREFKIGQVQRALKSIRTTMRYLNQNVNPRLAMEVLLLNLPGTVRAA